MEGRKLVFIASECQPFFASGGLGDVIGSLPNRIYASTKGEFEVAVILPLYSKMTPKYRNKLVYVGQMVVPLAWRKQYCGIFKYQEKGVTYYFLDNEYYFKRHNYYGYFDDGERFAFFSRAALEAILFLDFVPDIIHAHDWQAGLVPVYLKTLYLSEKRFAKIKVVYTIHNIEYQGIFSNDEDIIEDVFGLSSSLKYLLDYNGSLNIMKGAMELADVVTTVSPTYAQEICYPEYAHGLQYQVERIKHKLVGILNGIDKAFYNPARDKALFMNYNKKNAENKVVNKTELQKMLNLPVDEKIPVLSIISRLVAHKGMDIIKDSLETLMTEKIQIVVLGTGDVHYEGFFKDLEKKYSSKLRVIIAYNQDLARKIYSGSDIFLMPSKSEPCGLAQMIACRYGTIPVVRKTGGLADSIFDFSNPDGNGYVFQESNKESLLEAVHRALTDYEDHEGWKVKVETVMNVDFGWTRSAKEYIKIYEALLN